MGKHENRPLDEAERLELEERLRKGLRMTLLCAFALLAAGGIAGAHFARGAATLPLWALVTPAPSFSPSPVPSPSPAMTAAVGEIASSPAVTEAFAPTAIDIDGTLAGVIASREAAETLLADARAYFQLMADGVGIPDTSIMNEVNLRDATADEAAQLSTYENLYAFFTGEDTPLVVLTTLTSSSVTNVSCETITEQTKYLLKGTRLIVRMGRDGSTHEVTVARYINGVLDCDPETTTGSIAEPVDGYILEGTQSVDRDAVPGRSQGQEGPNAGDLRFIRPVAEGSVSLNFGQYKGVLHLGLDYEAKEGDPVFASCAGTVVCVMERGGYGLMVEIDHGNGFVTRYAHLSGAAVSIGDAVAQGDVIAYAGSSGNCAGPVLHFEIRADGIAYNPRFYLS